jgi:hypothetical protein
MNLTNNELQEEEYDIYGKEQLDPPFTRNHFGRVQEPTDRAGMPIRPAEYERRVNRAATRHFAVCAPALLLSEIHEQHDPTI